MNRHRNSLYKRIAALYAVCYVFLANSALAGAIPDIQPNNVNPIGGGAVTGVARNIVTSAVNILLFVTGAVAVIFVILGGFKYITSSGDPKKAEEARKTVINAMIGIIIVVAAYFIIQVAVGGGQAITTIPGAALNF